MEEKAAVATKEELPKLAGHHLVVEGEYFSAESNANTGHTEKKRLHYHEEFALPAEEHCLISSNALSRILGNGQLEARLRSKDKNFRVIATHTVVDHENLFETQGE